MDRRLKERLIGATILVVLIVLIVPELLSGPKHAVDRPAAAGSAAETVRNVTVDLATSKATPAEGPGASAASGPPPDVPASAPPETGDRSAAERVEPERPPPPVNTTLRAQQPSSPAALDKTSSAPNTLRHGWAVQIGSFSSRANAEKQMSRLKTRDSSVYLSSGGRGSALRFRVRLGPFPDRGAAERAISRLKKEGLSASLVPP